MMKGLMVYDGCNTEYYIVPHSAHSLRKWFDSTCLRTGVDDFWGGKDMIPSSYFDFRGIGSLLVTLSALGLMVWDCRILACEYVG